MRKNMGNIDRMIRVIVATVVAVLFFSNIISGIWATVAMVLAGIFLATSLVSFCPLYALVGIRTCPAARS